MIDDFYNSDNSDGEDRLDYKEAYLTMMRASEQAIRQLEASQQRAAKTMLDLIKAQQQAEELLLRQEDTL